MKIRAILAMSLVTLSSSSSAPAEPWLRSIFGSAAPQRPPGLIGGMAHPSKPIARPRPAATSVDKPSQKPAGGPGPTDFNVVTIGPSAAARAGNPAETGSTPQASTFPPSP